MCEGMAVLCDGCAGRGVGGWLCWEGMAVLCDGCAVRGVGGWLCWVRLCCEPALCLAP